MRAGRSLSPFIVLAIVGACFSSTEAEGAQTSRSDSVFAPVAAQQTARLAQLMPHGRTVSTRHIHLMLDAGLADDAAAAQRGLTGDAREIALARLRIALTRQDFAAARPLVQTLAARRDPTDTERSLRYAYLFTSY